VTNEERQRLCETLQAWASSPALTNPGSFSLLGRFIREAVKEIEQLTKENKELKKSLHHLHSARETDMGVAE
jgi:hypothetical protein